MINVLLIKISKYQIVDDFTIIDYKLIIV